MFGFLQSQPNIEDDEEHAQRMFNDDDEDSTSQPQIMGTQISPPRRVTENREALTRIDPEKQLKIWVKDFQDEDVLVEEYLKLLLLHEFNPVLPSPEDLGKVEKHPENLITSEETQVLVINLFTSHLQNLYFLTNVGKATEKGITLFNPQTKFLVPNHALLPELYFDRMKENKTNLVLAMQQDSILAVKFTNELLLLRAYDLISKDLEKNNCASAERKRYEFLVLCNVSRKNFKIHFRLKTIDWETKQGKAHGSLPKWRKEKGTAPTTTKNKHAEKLSRAVLSGQVDLKSDQGRAQLTEFLDINKKQTSKQNQAPTTSQSAVNNSVQLSDLSQAKVQPNQAQTNPQPATPSNQGQNEAQQRATPGNITSSQAQKKVNKKPEGRDGVKSYKQLFPETRPKRKENPKFNTNRNLHNGTGNDDE